MAFTEFIESADATDHTIVLANRESPQPLAGMLEDLFADQPVEFAESDLPDADADQVLLVADGEVVATSPLSALAEAVLLVNSDLFITGSRDVTEVTLPDVLAGLEGVPFTLRGYPESNAEKLLLIVVSRYIERLAYERGAGRLRASFQRLSRIDDERGTRQVYRLLADTDLDLHLYGVPDWIPPAEFDAVVHGGRTEPFLRSWFVLFRPPEGGESPRSDRAADGRDDDSDLPPAEGPAALVAREVDPRRWRGLWTTDPERVSEVERYVERHL